VSDCCLTPNQQYEELDFSKNSSKPYKNTNLDKEDILTIILFFQYPRWVSEWLLYNANSAIFQLYYGESKLIMNEMMMRSALF
jgi:hypothetical protein